MHDVGKSRAGVNERKAGIVLVGDRLAFGHEHKHLRNSLLKRCPREDDDVSVHVNVGSLNVRRRLERTQDRPQLHSNIFLSRSLRWQVEYGTLSLIVLFSFSDSFVLVHKLMHLLVALLSAETMGLRRLGA